MSENEYKMSKNDDFAKWARMDHTTNNVTHRPNPQKTLPYTETRRLSHKAWRAGALKWGTPLSIGKIRPIIGHNLETAQDRR